MNRNCWRFFLSIRSFSDEQKAAAKRRFDGASPEDKKKNTYYTDTINLLIAKGYHSDAKKLKEAWNNI